MSWEQELKTTLQTMMNTHTLTNKRIDNIEKTEVEDLIDQDIKFTLIKSDISKLIDNVEDLEQKIINLNAKIKGTKDAR